MTANYDRGAAKRAVNLSLNEDLVRRVRGLTGNLAEEVERLLAGYLEAEETRRAAADASLTRAVEALNEFGEKHGWFADEHSTL